MSRVLRGHLMAPGDAAGRALVVPGGLSLAMAVDVTEGRITDVHSPQAGAILVGRVLVMPAGRGSSSSSTALAEAIRRGTAPAAILLAEADRILAAGAIVARRLYGRACPIVVLDPTALAGIATNDRVTIRADGIVTIEEDQRG